MSEVLQIHTIQAEIFILTLELVHSVSKDASVTAVHRKKSEVTEKFREINNMSFFFFFFPAFIYWCDR